jgi:hypothetical protein
VEGVVVHRVAEHFGVDARAAAHGVIVLPDPERTRALAHHEAVAIFVERPACKCGGIALPAAHRPDEIECTERERTERGFGAAGDHHVRPAVADVAQRLADCDCAARAGV